MMCRSRSWRSSMAADIWPRASVPRRSVPWFAGFWTSHHLCRGRPLRLGKSVSVFAGDSAMRLGVPYLLAELVAERSVFPHVAEVHKQRRPGNQHTRKEKPSVALCWKTPHEPEGNRDQKSCQRGQDGQWRQGVTIDRRRVVDEPAGGDRGEQRHPAGNRQPPRIFPRPAARPRVLLQPVTCNL